MKTALEWLKLLGVILVAILLGEVQVVKDAALFIDRYRSWLLPLIIGLAMVGFLMLLWGWIRVGMLMGQPMSHEEVEQLAARTQILGPSKRFSKVRLWGKTTGVKVDPPMEWTFQELKQAWRAGTWWSDPAMRQKYLVTVGGVLFILGMFALFFVALNPASVKLILAAAILYALARLTWGFWRSDLRK